MKKDIIGKISNDEFNKLEEKYGYVTHIEITSPRGDKVHCGYFRALNRDELKAVNNKESMGDSIDASAMLLNNMFVAGDKNILSNPYLYQCLSLNVAKIMPSADLVVKKQ